MTVPARVALTPLADTFARFSDLPVDLRFGSTGDGDWVNCADLLGSPDRFDVWRKKLAEWMVEEYGDSSARATAGYVMGWYLSIPGFLAGLLFHTARRVPSLRPADLAFRLAADDRPHPDGLALLSDEFACLPDDPAGNHPTATVVANEAALAALLRARYIGHAAEFVASFGPTVRLGRRMLWAAATDALDSGTWNAAQLNGDEVAGVLDAALLLPEKLDPFTSASTLYLGDEGWTRRRESCCFHYVLPEASPCSTCPRICS